MPLRHAGAILDDMSDRSVCSVCGTHRITNTVETEIGIKALCAFHYAAVTDHSREEYAAEQAMHRHRARTA